MAQNLGNLFIDGEDTIEDKTGNHLTTVYGDLLSTTQKKYGNSSIYCNGNTRQGVSVPVGGDFNFGTADFTIDFWYFNTEADRGCYLTQTAALDGSFGSADNQIFIAHDYADSSEGWYLGIGGDHLYFNGVTIPAFTNRWLHIAVTRESGVLKMYFDGVKKHERVNTTNVVSTNILQVGGLMTLQSGIDNPKGYIDNFRLAKGTALWTNNFDVADKAVLFYENEPANPNRSDNVSELFNSKQTLMRGQASAGFYRPTIAEFFTSKDFEQIKKTITAKSVVLDFANNWGKVSYMGVRSVEFKIGGELILLPGNFIDYFSTEYNAAFSTDKAFNTGYLKTGSWSGTSWMSGLNIRFNQRIIVVFNDEIEFDEIVINNTHTSGTQTDTGVKDTKIYSSTDAITNTVFNSIVPNSKLLFDGQIPMHSAVNGRDDFVVYHN